MQRSDRIRHGNHGLLSIIVWVCTLPLTGCEAILETPEVRCNRLAEAACKAEQGDNYPEAEKLYVQAVSEAQRSSNLLQLPYKLDQLAAIYIHERKTDKAAAALGSALDVYRATVKGKIPSYDTLLVRQLLVKDCDTLANLEFQLGNLSRADELYKEALSQNESDLDDVNVRSKLMQDYAPLLRKLGREKEANDFEVTLAADDLNGQDYDKLESDVITYYLQSDYDPSKEESINRKIDILQVASNRYKGRVPRAEFMLGLRELAKKQPAQAETHFRRATELYQNKVDQIRSIIKMDPDFLQTVAEAITMLAHSLEIQGKVKEADATYQRACTFDAKTPIKSLLRLKRMYETRNSGEIDKLTVRILRMIDQQPNLSSYNPNVLIDLAKIHHNLGRQKEERTFFREAIKVGEKISDEQSSEKVFFYTNLADRLIECGHDKDEVIPFYEQGTKLCQKKKLYKLGVCGTCMHHYADILRSLKRPDEAANVDLIAKPFPNE